MDKAAGRVLLPPSVEPKKYVIDLVPNLEVGHELRVASRRVASRRVARRGEARRGGAQRGGARRPFARVANHGRGHDAV